MVSGAAPRIRIEIEDLGLSAESPRSDLREMPLALRRVKGGGGDHEVASKVFLGGPDYALLRSRDDEDPAIADRRQGADFWSVMMTLSIESATDERIARAWLRVDLAADTGDPPTAFYLRPGRREEDVGMERSGTAEATIKAVKLGSGIKQTWTQHDVEILARNRHRSDPNWTVTPSKGRRIDGDEDFLLIVKVPRGTAGPRGRVAFGANIEWREERFLRDRTGEVSWGGNPVEFQFIGAG